jgi:hypothetical protein
MATPKAHHRVKRGMERREIGIFSQRAARYQLVTCSTSLEKIAEIKSILFEFFQKPSV